MAGKKKTVMEQVEEFMMGAKPKRKAKKAKQRTKAKKTAKKKTAKKAKAKKAKK